jgi:pyrroloquinoline quinone (PQQ) biosynthesis protein C
MLAEAVLSGKTLPAREFCDVLINEVKTKHARLHHPFYAGLYEGKLPLEDVRVWAKEAWGIFSYNVAINTAKLVRFEGTPRPVLGHRALFMRFSEAIGIPAKELERCERDNDFLPLTMLARTGWLDIALRSETILDQVAATNCCNEYSNQLTGGKFFRAFRDHYGLKPHDIEFFREHGEADTEHSNIGYELMERFATTNEIQAKALRALRRGLSIWWAITDGVARECARLKTGVLE